MKQIPKSYHTVLALLLLVLFLLSSCTQNSTPSKERFEQVLKLSLPNYTVSKYIDTHKGYNGEMYAILHFDGTNSTKFQNAITASGFWKRLPINTVSYANVTWAGNLTPQSSVGKIPSDIQNGLWYFCDRSDRLYTYADRRFTVPSSNKDQIIIEAETCKNFTLAVYDIDNCLLYIYMYDKMPS
ncbi:MAG: hypothetical protein ACI4M3_04970 [Acutalibacteraceae bacterium]